MTWHVKKMGSVGEGVKKMRALACKRKKMRAYDMDYVASKANIADLPSRRSFEIPRTLGAEVQAGGIESCLRRACWRGRSRSGCVTDRSMGRASNGPCDVLVEQCSSLA